ncbi:peptidoglycan editing factor PgeF [Sulfurimonas sp. HSL-1716]|uniref:peptidoglycan editing factor PgeF n=1 Tax=Hydrocurvibacter sulfurireducens TaxID=3131937 RepID=UPI0031F7B033
MIEKFTEVLCRFSTRDEGGNLAFHVGDDIKAVDANHALLAQKLGYNKDVLVHMKQIHSDIVHVVTPKDTFHTPPTCDALVTNRKNVPLMVMVADCTPVLFYDPVHKAIGVAHAGRAGAFGNIVKNVVQTMQSEYGSNPQEIIVSVGSAIGVCCYEVGEEIYEESKKEFGYAFEKHAGNYYLDINKIILTQLKECGIQEEHIQNDGVCSACNTKEYFSYRAEGQTGRFAGILMLK